MPFCKEFSPLLHTSSANFMQKELMSEANYLSQTSRGIEPRYPKCQRILLSHQCANSDIFTYQILTCQASKSSSSPISLKGFVSSIFMMNFWSFPFPSSLGQSKQKKENWYFWSRFSALGLFAAWKEHQDDWHSKIIERLGYLVLRFSK